MRLAHRKSIYEKKGVYGDEGKLTSSYKRLDKMLWLLSGIDKPKSVLDLGCGTGYLSNILKQRYPNAKIFGVDISNTALSRARKQYPSLTFVNADAERKLPFHNEHFDLVVSGEHIEHLKDVDTYLQEIFRITKKNGYLLLTTPNLASWLNRLLLLVGRQPWYLEPSLRRTFPIFRFGSYVFPENPGSYAVGHLRLFTLDMIKKLLLHYGFKMENVKGAEIMTKPVLKQIDTFFTNIPSLSFGLVTLSRRT